ncbi:hypothetical protein MHBO_003568 [Bonamia ostreae]|uniref:Uncharacterized protein n=1 Tax=Bonamia ostreae TaxID=126728 RepID=A0ABV2AQW2_9EUKA
MAETAFSEKEQRETNARFREYIEWARKNDEIEDIRPAEEVTAFEAAKERYLEIDVKRRLKLRKLFKLRRKFRKEALEALPPRLRLAAIQPFNDDKRKFRFYPLQIYPATERQLLPNDLEKRKRLWHLDKSFDEAN